jgi:hypothetical protein
MVSALQLPCSLQRCFGGSQNCAILPEQKTGSEAKKPSRLFQDKNDSRINLVSTQGIGIFWRVHITEENKKKTEVQTSEQYKI